MFKGTLTQKPSMEVGKVVTISPGAIRKRGSTQWALGKGAEARITHFKRHRTSHSLQKLPPPHMETSSAGLSGLKLTLLKAKGTEQIWNSVKIYSNSDRMLNKISICKSTLT